MKPSALVLALAGLVAGCKTVTDSGLKDAGAGPADNSLGCKFVSPMPGAETFQIRATPTDGSQLLNIKQLHSARRATADGATDLGAAPAADKAALTERGHRNVRTVFKDLFEVDFKKFACFAVQPGGAGAKARFLCLAKAKNAAGTLDALWVTNDTTQKYATDLTVFQATCAPGP